MDRSNGSSAVTSIRHYESRGLADSFVDRLRSALPLANTTGMAPTDDSQRRTVGPWTPCERLGRGNPAFAHSHDSGGAASQYGTGVVVMPAAGALVLRDGSVR